MPTLSPSRCQVSIPLEITGQDSELCGSDSSFVCENCGPICQGCADTFPCPLTSDGKHTPIQALTPSPVRFDITEPNGTKTHINGTYHNLSFAETLAALDPFQQPAPIIIKGHSGGPDGKWDEVQAIQHQPFVYIQYNGSEHVWADCDDIAVLLEMLSRYRIDPYWEEVATLNPCAGEHNEKWGEPGEPQFVDGPRMYACDGVVSFGGNFLNYSHAFNVHTNHKPTIDALMAAIAKNDQVVEDGGTWMAEQYRAAAARAEGGAQ